MISWWFLGLGWFWDDYFYDGIVWWFWHVRMMIGDENMMIYCFGMILVGFYEDLNESMMIRWLNGMWILKSLDLMEHGMEINGPSMADLIYGNEMTIQHSYCISSFQGMQKFTFNFLRKIKGAPTFYWTNPNWKWRDTPVFERKWIQNDPNGCL